MKKLRVGGIILLCVIVVGVAGFFVYKKFIYKKPASNKVAGQDVLREQLIAARKTTSAATKQDNERVADLAKKITSVDDLKKLSEADEAKVGMLLINQLVKTDPAKAKLFIAYLMLRNDETGLEASKQCYVLNASDASAQKICVDRATEQARAQGIISANEELPASYFGEKSADQEQG